MLLIMFYELFLVSNSDSDDTTFFPEGILKSQVRIPYVDSNTSLLSTLVFGVANASAIFFLQNRFKELSLCI